MSEAINSIDNNQKVSAILVSNSTDDKLESNSQKKIAEKLLGESSNYSNDSKAKSEQARALLSAADALEKLANAVRVYADQIKTKSTKKEESVKEVVQVPGQALEMPIPKDATPEQLKNIAKDLEDRAKENRRKADDLLIESEKSMGLAKQLKEHAGLIAKNDMKLSDVEWKSGQAHNEGLNMVFKKLGIYRLDAEYKEQVAYAQKRAAQDQLQGKV